MSAMSLRLPNSLHEAAKELAEPEGMSVTQLVATALAEKLAVRGAQDPTRPPPPERPARLRAGGGPAA